MVYMPVEVIVEGNIVKVLFKKQTVVDSLSPQHCQPHLGWKSELTEEVENIMLIAYIPQHSWEPAPCRRQQGRLPTTHVSSCVPIGTPDLKVLAVPVRHNYFWQCFTSSEYSNKLIWINCGEDAIRIQQIHVTIYAQIWLNGTREILVVVSKKYIIHSTATWSGGN